MRSIGFCTLVVAAWVNVAPTFADDTAPLDASPLQNAVRLTPAPELSLMVPHGWIACEPETNQQLGGNVLPTQFQEKLCDPSRPKHAVSKLVNPDLSEFVMVIIMDMPVDGKQKLAQLLSETGDAQQRDIQPLCAGVLSGQPDSTCTASIGLVAGQQALIGTAQRNPRDGKVHVNGKFVVLSTNNHVYALLFASLETAKPEAAAIIDAIIDSIETS